MTIEEHHKSAKNMLDRGIAELRASHYDSAINFFIAAASAVRQILEHTWRIKCEKALHTKPPKKG